MSLGIDPNSYANYHEIEITDLRPNLTADFARKFLYGYTDITAVTKHSNVAYLDLDMRGLAIESVQDLDVFEKSPPNSYLHYTIPRNHTIGAQLRIPVPADKQNKGDVVRVRVNYSTSELSGGIQWFEPNQTAGKKHPFMYTQFQAILARTMIPCQDTPAVKHPYTMTVTVPDPLIAACSGRMISEPQRNAEKGTITYVFHQAVKIPSYLIALAIGALKREQIGPRSFVWCEQEQVEAAKDEFSQTESFLQAAEYICGMEYKWGTYDLLVLPGAFPYGGMENPNLTFISASLITGNKELTDVIAHEITHSWSGNLVTNSSWPDFWLNEGFTMYIERLILMRVAEQKEKGTGIKVRDFQACLGYGELISTVKSLQESPELTRLAPDMRGIDPDDAFSRIPYEKGCLLLLYLESLVASDKSESINLMMEWLRDYFVSFKEQSITNQQMIAHFTKRFPNVNIDWNEWLYGEGLGPWNPMKYLDQTMNKDAQALADKWMKSGDVVNQVNKSDLEWEPAQTMVFLDHMLNDGGAVSHSVIKQLDDVYQFSKSKNVEISVRFLKLALENGYTDILPVIEDFVSKHGRSVYLRPIYKQLIVLSQQGKLKLDQVKSIYQKNRSYYHSVIRNTFDAQLAH